MSASTTESTRTPALRSVTAVQPRSDLCKRELEGSIHLTLPHISFRVFSCHLMCPVLHRFYLRYIALASQARLSKKSDVSRQSWAHLTQTGGGQHTWCFAEELVSCVGTVQLPRAHLVHYLQQAQNLLESPVPCFYSGRGIEVGTCGISHSLASPAAWRCQSHGQIFRNIKCYPENIQ